MKHRTLSVVALVTLIWSGQAKAEVDGNDSKSPTTALTLSLSATAAAWAAWMIPTNLSEEASEHPVATIFGAAGMIGTFVAPSVGHWYVGDRVWTAGLTTRVAGGAVFGAGALLALRAWGSERECGVCDPLMVAGISAYAVGSLYDIVTAPRAARLHNQATRSSPLVLAPAPLRSISGPAAGLSLSGSF